MNQSMHLLVYPAKDMDKAKALFRELLGVAPYVVSTYYAGFRTGDLEIGLDPKCLLIATVKDAYGNTLGLRQSL